MKNGITLFASREQRGKCSISISARASSAGYPSGEAIKDLDAPPVWDRIDDGDDCCVNPANSDVVYH
jgi:hypothetical protein